MAQAKIKNADHYDLDDIPEESIAVVFSYEVDLPTGSLMAYRTPADPSPMKLPGPRGIVVVPITQRRIWLQKVGGTKKFPPIRILGYTDDPEDLTRDGMRKLLEEIKEKFDL